MKRNRNTQTRGALRSLAVVLLAVILLFGALLYGTRMLRSGQWGASGPQKALVMRLANTTDLMQRARLLKFDLKTLANAITEQDIPAARDARALVQQDEAQLRQILDTPLWRFAAGTPATSDEVEKVNALLELVDRADETLLGPGLDLLESSPLSSLKVEGGLRVDTVLTYLDFFETAYPEALALMDEALSMDLSPFVATEKIAGYREKAQPLLEMADKAQALIPALRAILGGGDRLFMFAAQNSSELRGSGGFPGAIGMVRIRDGVLRLSDFTTVYDIMQQFIPEDIEISDVEDRLFDGRMRSTWDTDFCPDFERVASIWAASFKARFGEDLDGVISATPVIIQKLLRFLGEITLADGTVVNGDNATKVICHDLYFRYLGSNRHPNGEQIVDDLFAEAARKTLDLMLSDFSVSRLMDYYAFALDSFADRSLMLWLADEQGQELIRELGWNAGLNQDPEDPWIGLFYNCTSASKMTWWLDIVPELSEPVQNADGSLTYDLTVTYSNIMTPMERAMSSTYIVGYGVGITGTVYIFAPAGGHLSDVECNKDRAMSLDVYEGLDVAYALSVPLLSEPFVVRCRVTTAPGVDTPARLVLPPLMMDYR